MNIKYHIKVLFFLCATSTTFSVHATTKTILVLGDSLSAAYGIEIKDGWVNLLRHRLNQAIPDTKWTVLNAAVSGETTSGGLARLPSLLKKHNPDLCILALGANDGLRGLSLDKMQQNIAAMITRCQKNAKVLLLGLRLPPNYGNVYTSAFSNKFRALAKRHDVALVPFMLAGVSENRQMMQADELHPTARAQQIILENIWPELYPILHRL